MGWLARAAHVPLGYLGDAEKTARTFPVVTACATRCPATAPSPRPDGSSTSSAATRVRINSGGEKIFAEEVEHALKHHPAVLRRRGGRHAERALGPAGDRGRRAPRGAARDEAALRATAREHLAAYKVPRAFVFVEGAARTERQARLPLGRRARP